MYTDSIFVFGSTLFLDRKQDAISSLPIEMAWKIFSFLDDATLRFAAKAAKTWKRIITANTKLRKRLGIFELGLKLGSHHLARFHKDNKKRMKALKAKKYLPVYESKDTARKLLAVAQGAPDQALLFPPDGSRNEQQLLTTRGVCPVEITQHRSKRSGNDLVICAKRYKLY